MSSMGEVHFWLVDWEHECCGDQRKVGDTITPYLAYHGPVSPTEDEPTATVLRDGAMGLVGNVSDLKLSQPAWLIDTGTVSVGWRGKYPGGRVRCEGKLLEMRHEEATGEVTGRITGMRWHPAIYEKIEGVHTVIGYGRPTVIYNTNKYPGFPQPIPPGILKMREAAARGELRGPFTFEAAPMDDYQPTGWAFEFTIEV
jgi:hypothetical protein